MKFIDDFAKNFLNRKKVDDLIKKNLLTIGTMQNGNCLVVRYQGFLGSTAEIRVACGNTTYRLDTVGSVSLAKNRQLNDGAEIRINSSTRQGYYDGKKVTGATVAAVAGLWLSSFLTLENKAADLMKPMENLKAIADEDTGITYQFYKS